MYDVYFGRNQIIIYSHKKSRWLFSRSGAVSVEVEWRRSFAFSFSLYLAAIIDISQRTTDIFPSRFKLIVLPRGWDSLPVYLLHLHKFPAVSRCRGRGRSRRRRLIGKSKMYLFANKLCFLFSLAALVSFDNCLRAFRLLLRPLSSTSAAFHSTSNV